MVTIISKESLQRAMDKLFRRRYQLAKWQYGNVSEEMYLEALDTAEAVNIIYQDAE